MQDKMSNTDFEIFQNLVRLPQAKLKNALKTILENKY